LQLERSGKITYTSSKTALPATNIPSWLHYWF